MVRQKLPVPCSVQHQDDPWGPFSHQSVGFYMDQRQSGVRCKPNFLRTTYVIVRLAIQHARSTNDSHTKEPAKFALDFASCSSSTFQNNTVVGHFAPRHHFSPLIYGSTPHLRSSAVASIVIDIDHISLDTVLYERTSATEVSGYLTRCGPRFLGVLGPTSGLE
ncbi:hypothetical protein IG631_02210 [Alternaria alternata]|nr:hypothetical protein IG631_02210 [Alternaria alternata]